MVNIAEAQDYGSFCLVAEIMSTDIAKTQKIIDFYNFIRAEDFFLTFDRLATSGYYLTFVIIY